MLIFSPLFPSFSEDFKEAFNVYTKHQNEVIKTSYVNVYLKPFKCTPFIFFKPITSCVHSLAKHQNEASAHAQKPQMGDSFHLQNVNSKTGVSKTNSFQWKRQCNYLNSSIPMDTQRIRASLEMKSITQYTYSLSQRLSDSTRIYINICEVNNVLFYSENIVT